MEVRITRTDKMPDVCVVCGEPTDNKVVLPFLPRRNSKRKNVWFWANLIYLVGGGLLRGDPEAFLITVGLLFFPLMLVATILVIYRIFRWRFPTTQRTLPVCASHARQLNSRHRLRIWQLGSALAILYGGAWYTMSTNVIWPLYVAAGLFFLLVFLTEDFILRPVEVNETAVTLGAAHTEFVEKFDELNRVLTFDIGSQLIDGKSGEGIIFNR